MAGVAAGGNGIFNQVAAHADGAERLREVRAFVRWVHAFEANRSRGLFDLIRHIENLERNGLAQAPYDLSETEQNAVRVMTIHSSKGLEFRSSLWLAYPERSHQRNSRTF